MEARRDGGVGRGDGEHRGGDGADTEAGTEAGAGAGAGSDASAGASAGADVTAGAGAGGATASGAGDGAQAVVDTRRRTAVAVDTDASIRTPRAAGTGPQVGGTATTPTTADPDARRRRLAGAIALVLLLGVGAGLATGSSGFSLQALWADLHGADAGLLLGQIRAPRTLGAALVGGLLGLGGAIAQGLFRNPVADPFLLGSAAGASLGVVLVLAAAGLGGATISLSTVAWIERVGLVAGSFGGALAGIAMTLALARGAVQTLRLLLAGVVVGVLLNAVGDLVAVASPQALNGRQAFMLGSTSFLGWDAVALMGGGLALLCLLARRHARVLDALTLGEDSAASLGLDLGRMRLVLVAMLGLGTALAVSQAGLVAFVGLVAPHLVRRRAPGAHAWLLLASAGMGAALLLVADVLSRALIAPEELPVGGVTAVLGGCYLVWLLRQRSAP